MLSASHSRDHLRTVPPRRAIFLCVLNFVLIAAFTFVCLNFAAAQVSERAKPVSSPSSTHREKAITEMHQGQTSAALAEFREAVAEQPDDAVSYDYIGVILGEAGSLNEAVAEFEQAAGLDSSLPDPHFHLGLAYERLGKINDAILQYEAALRLNPSMQEARYGLSAVCAKLGDLDGAIFLLREVVASAPDFAEAHYNLGLNLSNRYKTSTGLKQKSDLDEAVQELKTAVQQQPDARSYLALGQLLSDHGDFTAAIENLQHAAKLEPNNVEYHYTLGLALRLKGEMDSAGSEFQETIRINPQHALAHRSLGLVLRERGDLQAAANELHLAVSQRPDDPDATNCWGQCS